MNQIFIIIIYYIQKKNPPSINLNQEILWCQYLNITAMYLYLVKKVGLVEVQLLWPNSVKCEEPEHLPWQSLTKLAMHKFHQP